MAIYVKRGIDTSPSNLQLNTGLTARSLRHVQLNWNWRLIKMSSLKWLLVLERFPLLAQIIFRNNLMILYRVLQVNQMIWWLLLCMTRKCPLFTDLLHKRKTRTAVKPWSLKVHFLWRDSKNIFMGFCHESWFRILLTMSIYHEWAIYTTLRTTVKGISKSDFIEIWCYECDLKTFNGSCCTSQRT